MSEFTYKTGKEILNSKDVLKNELREQEYADFCKYMNKFWEENDIEKKLVFNDAAEIKINQPRLHNPRPITAFTAMYSEIAERYIGSNIINYKNIIGHEFPFNTYETKVAEALSDYFHIDNYKMFCDFMKEHGFEWYLSLEVDGAIPAQLFDKLFFERRWFITEYSIILRIECKEKNAELIAQ